ncbi:hypothetical protein B0H67DRAFT_551721 [Lasiosphaeris hirsuta]|uniref:Uncharacterized protein n=1 Tax=Lasiosphaeris hirsuta TaxID=260670 RepID=A0AA40AP00_9PEZI|nr:hypothetical protein B0H67DRAFT_551721 [Lasiosphaeris hirsuta]
MAQPIEQNREPGREVMSYWPTIKAHLSEGWPFYQLPPPIVRCDICYGDLDLIGIPPRGPDSPGGEAAHRERVVLLPCGHLVGKDCSIAYSRQSRNAHAADDSYYYRCSVCRFVLRFDACRCGIKRILLPAFTTTDTQERIAGYYRHQAPTTEPNGGPRLRGNCVECLAAELRNIASQSVTLRRMLLTGLYAQYPFGEMRQALEAGDNDKLMNLVTIAMQKDCLWRSITPRLDLLDAGEEKDEDEDEDDGSADGNLAADGNPAANGYIPDDGIL